MQLEPRQLTQMAFLDPGSGKSKDQLKRRSARSAIIVVSTDWLRRIYVREAWADRCNTEVLCEKIFEFNTRWRPNVFGIEANAQQSLFFDMLVTRAREKRIEIPLHAVNQSTRIEKDFRIRTAIQPLLGNGQLFCLESHLELIEELRTFPQSATKDLVDALASVIALVPQRVPQPEIDYQENERLEYLREIGAPPDYIERVAQGLA